MKLRMIGAAIFAVGLAAGCGSSSTAHSSLGSGAGVAAKLAAIPVFTVRGNENGPPGKDDHFDSPDSVPAGLVQVNFVDNGIEPHQVNFARPKPGFSTDQIDQALGGLTPESALGLLEFTGGSNGVEPKSEQKSILNFEPGTYYMLCFMPSADDGRFHLDHGMFKKVTVLAAGATSDTTAKAQIDAVRKATVGEITLEDFAVLLPKGFNGRGWYKVINSGPQSHEAELMKVADGKSANDVFKYLSAPTPSIMNTAPTGQPPTGESSDASTTSTSPRVSAKAPRPFTDVGGFASIGKGLDGWVFLNLPRGDYVAMCFVPNTMSYPGKPGPPDLAPHFTYGMFRPFTSR